jgi:glycosyltransferase involved in cell wall biosynthesis
MRIDLHVHSKYSKRPSAWILQKIGCPESFTEPLLIYERARSRGMTHVTITDHNRVEGALEIAHLPGTFVSEEVTTYFPEDGCKLHVLALGISERQHEDIQKVRQNVFELVGYLRGAGIFHALAHPLYGVNDRLTPAHFEKALLLFNHFELNGARNDASNACLEAVIAHLTRGRLEDLADRHGIAPHGERPWRKGLTGGSDDHSGLDIARTYTEIPGAATVDAGLEGLSARRGRIRRRPPKPETMGHNLYSIAYQYYCSQFRLERFASRDPLLGFLDKALRGRPEETGRGVLAKVSFLIASRRRHRNRRRMPENLIDLLRQETRKLLWQDPRLGAVTADDSGGHPVEAAFFDFVNQVSNRALVHFADHSLSHLTGANVCNIFHSIGSAGGLYTLLAPYFIAFSLFSRDRHLSREVLQRFGLAPDGETGGGVAHFTDTFHDVNGVATLLQQQARSAAAAGLAMEVVTCDRSAGAEGCPGVRYFEPVGSFDMPAYPGQRIHYPPIMEMLRYCYEKGFDRIHSATPGPLGLAALAVARILKLPISGTYHTALPQYARFLTGDAVIEELTWKYMLWFYDQMDIVHAPSEATRRELVDRGLNAEKVRCASRGVDTRRFSPDKRNGFFERHYGVQGALKLLYVGRISREKNLDLLADVFRALVESGAPAHLVLVGDGPDADRLIQRLGGLPFTFTGRLEGDALASAYASSDIFVFPSTTDTLGNVVLEAQASGLPVVVADRGGPMENIVPGETGLVVRADDRESLLDALVHLMSSPERCRRMGARGRRLMEARALDPRHWDAGPCPDAPPPEMRAHAL